MKDKYWTNCCTAASSAMRIPSLDEMAAMMRIMMEKPVLVRIECSPGMFAEIKAAITPQAIPDGRIRDLSAVPIDLKPGMNPRLYKMIFSDTSEEWVLDGYSVKLPPRTAAEVGT